MQKTLVAIAASLSIAGTALADQASRAGGGSGSSQASSFYDLKTTTLVEQAGRPRRLSRQSHTGRQRGQQVRLHATVQRTREAASGVKDKGFAVLGFPSNDFGEQEPDSAEEIAQFCKLTYDVTFPMFAKVVTGRDRISRRFIASSERGTPAGLEL